MAVTRSLVSFSCECPDATIIISSVTLGSFLYFGEPQFARQKMGPTASAGGKSREG